VDPLPSGSPHRAKYYRRALEDIRKHKDVLFWTGEQILD
jgi:allantoinase